MPWGSGAFTRTNGTYNGAGVWASDAAAGIDILAGRHDTHDKDLADGINACLNKNGQNAATADISWGGFKITNLGNGTAATDAAAYGQTITALGFNATSRVLTATRAAGNITLTLPATAPGAFGLFQLPATSAGAYLRDDGAFAAVPVNAVLQFQTVAGAGTMVANTAERVTAAVTRTLPSTLAVNDQFVVHAQGGAVVISTPHTIRTGATLVCSPGDTLTVEQGNTVHLVANSTTELGIV